MDNLFTNVLDTNDLYKSILSIHNFLCRIELARYVQRLNSLFVSRLLLILQMFSIIINIVQRVTLLVSVSISFSPTRNVALIPNIYFFFCSDYWRMRSNNNIIDSFPKDRKIAYAGR